MSNRLQWTDDDLARIQARQGQPASAPESATKLSVPGALALLPPAPWPVMNKWEREFGMLLRAEFSDRDILPQALTFRLAKATSYTPDWIVARTRYAHISAPLLAFEVKGFWRQAGRVKLKMAARLFPFVCFVAVTRPEGKAGGWKREVISP